MMLMDVREQATTPAFRSCLLIAPQDAPTRRFMQALHHAGIAVLQRDAAAMTDLAGAGHFDLLAWVAGRCELTDARAIRALAGHGRPLIVLFEDADPECLARAFEAGAAACLRLDADERVVVGQVEALLRLSAGQDLPADEPLLHIGDLTVDRYRCEVWRRGERVPLSPTEFKAIEFMARCPGRVLQAHEILNAITDGYRYQPAEANDVFKVYARRIRKKLEPDSSAPRYLVNVRGFGYRLEGGAIVQVAARPA
jgi:DNA-binding response OmpR family regulator